MNLQIFKKDVEKILVYRINFITKVLSKQDLYHLILDNFVLFLTHMELIIKNY
jgi:hypothetical protein